MDLGWLWWFGAALVLGVVEMLTVDLLFLMLAGGAVAGGLAGLLGAPFWLQILVAAAVAVALVFGVRPWALARLKVANPDSRTGVDAQIGKSAIVVADVSDRAGRIKLSGEVWTARIEQPSVVLPAGSDVVVQRIEGATAYVSAPDVVADPSQPYGPITQGF